MMIETGVEVTVYTDEDYKFVVYASDQLGVSYVEDGRDNPIDIGFGSLEEMEAVARAMLKVVEFARK